MKRESAIVGAADHCGWAVLMTVGANATLLDRRRVELLDDGLPRLPHHHEAQGLPVAGAEALIARVQRSAEARAAECLAALAGAVASPISAIALRACPPLPDTIAERVSNYRAQTMADGIMYRRALAKAAGGRGWRVHWYESKTVFDDAAQALRRDSIEPLLQQAKAAHGRPWQKDQRVAMAAALLFLVP